MNTQEQIQALLSNQRAYFLKGNTRSVQGRCNQLEKLRLTIKKNERAIMDALKKDLNKSEFEAMQQKSVSSLRKYPFHKRI
jgi:aldehyde dehydrogenase (NAD+)